MRSGSQGQPVRVPSRGHLPLEVQLVRRSGLLRPAARGHLDPQAHPLAPVARRHLEHRHRAQGRPDLGLHPHGASGHRDRPQGRRGRQDPQGRRARHEEAGRREGRGHELGRVGTRPETDATLLAQGVAEQLAGRVSFRRAMRRACRRRCARAPSASACSAAAAWAAPRCPAASGTARAACRCTLRAKIDFGTAEGKTTFGQIGVKVWVYHGDEIPQAEQETERLRARARAGLQRRRLDGRAHHRRAEAAEVAEVEPLADGTRGRRRGPLRPRPATLGRPPAESLRRPAEATDAPGAEAAASGSAAAPETHAPHRSRGKAGLMLAPKKVKHRKVHRGRRRGRAKGAPRSISATTAWSRSRPRGSRTARSRRPASRSPATSAAAGRCGSTSSPTSP